jgi:glycosyltransferase involved in cell wall biosynthesis
MKDSLLLLMTPNMSLEKWDAKGQLSRELNYYTTLCEKSGLKLSVFSYGRDDLKYNLDKINVLTMPNWIPFWIPFRLQNLIYTSYALIVFRKSFKRVLISKTNQFSSANFGLVLKLFFGIPLITRMGFYYSHFNKISSVRKIKELLTFRFSNAILTTSKEAADHIIRSCHIRSEKIFTILNSINLERFKVLELRKEWDLIVVGRLEKSKNISLILEVLNRLNRKSLIIGEGSLEYLVRDAVNKNENLSWLSRVDNLDLPNYYNRAKCFMLLSEYEGNPKVLLEAMACGLPSVATNVPGTRECIIHNQNGLLVEKDVEEIVTVVNNLLIDETNRKILSENAVDWVNTYCNYHINIEKEVKLYSEIVDLGKLE